MDIFYALKGIYHEDEVQELDKKFEVKDVITLHVPELIGERHLSFYDKTHFFYDYFVNYFLKV